MPGARWPGTRTAIAWCSGAVVTRTTRATRFTRSTCAPGRWRRESLPSEVWEPLGDSQFFAVDGPRNAPTSSHTYDNQEFLPQLDRFITFGGAKFNGKQKFVLEDGVTLTGPYLWDPNRAGANSVGGTDGSQVRPTVYRSVTGGQMWDNRDTVRNRGIGSVRPSADWVNSTSAYVRNGSHDAILITEAPRTLARLFRYTINDVASPETDTWELLGIDSTGYGNQGAGAYDPVRKLFARTANTRVRLGDRGLESRAARPDQSLVLRETDRLAAAQ